MNNNNKMESKNGGSRVILWSSMRSISTAFLKSVSQLDGVNVLHEPLTPATLLGPQRFPGVYVNAEIDPKLTYEAAFKEICNHQKGKDFFSKILCVTVNNHKEMLLKDEMKEFKHVFLIRKPEKMVPSVYQMQRKINVFENFDALLQYCMLDFQSHFSLYEFVKEHLDANPLLIDADDLLRSPEGVMKEFCHRVGFTYDAKMLQWEPDAIPGTEDVAWRKAFQVAEKSNCFIRRQLSNRDEGIPDDDMERINETINVCQPFYEKLYCHRFVPDL